MDSAMDGTRAAKDPPSVATAAAADAKQEQATSHAHLFGSGSRLSFGTSRYRLSSVTGNPLSGVIICPARKEMDSGSR